MGYLPGRPLDILAMESIVKRLMMYVALGLSLALPNLSEAQHGGGGGGGGDHGAAATTAVAASGCCREILSQFITTGT